MKKLADITVEIDGVKVCVPAPYCTPSEWAERVGLSLEQVNLQLERGSISRHQPVSRGRVFVNVVQEIKKSIAGF